MTYLGDVSAGRDNNLNLIRAIAATLVLVSHAWPIANGVGTIEPLKLATGHTLGSISVFVFFAISGFLITMSFERSSSWVSFMVARVLRLLPGLVVSLLLVALIMGPLVTTLGLLAYYTAPETWTFILRNTTLVFLQFGLPGVFLDNAYPEVEGSIWTLIYEVICYLGVFALGMLGILRRGVLAAVVFAAYLALWLWSEHTGIDNTRLAHLQMLSLPFVIGAGLYLLRRFIVLSLPLAGLLWALVWVVAQTPLAGVGYDLMLMLALSYSVFWLGYIPGGPLRAYNRIGDYSYGIYIYAFPLQGLMIWWHGSQTPWENILWALPPTLILSVLSWHLIEGPAMGMKGRVVNGALRLLPPRLAAYKP